MNQLQGIKTSALDRDPSEINIGMAVSRQCAHVVSDTRGLANPKRSRFLRDQSVSHACELIRMIIAMAHDQLSTGFGNKGIEAAQ